MRRSRMGFTLVELLMAIMVTICLTIGIAIVIMVFKILYNIW